MPANTGLTLPGLAATFWQSTKARCKAWAGGSLGEREPALRADSLQRGSVLYVCIIAGLCGAYLGTTNSLQNALESAQVLSGKVTYPADNPFYLYHIKAWTLINQIPALMLTFGFSERVVSILLGAFIGMVSFQAISVATLVVSRSRWLAIALPLILEVSGLYVEIHNRYALRFFSERPWQCYGVLGTSWAALCWALYGAKCRRIAAFMAGMAPAIHPTLGAWCLAVSFVAMLLTQRQHPQPWRTVLGWLALGLAVSLGSFAVHLYHARNVPTITTEARDAYVQAFSLGWDTHRRPAPLAAPAMYYGLCAAALGLVWLLKFRGQLDSGAYYLTAVMLVSAIIGLALVVSTHFREQMPTILLMAMPARFINVTCFLLPALVLGALWRRNHIVPTLMAAGVCLYLILRVTYLQLELFYIPDIWFVVACATLMLLASAWRWVEGNASRTERSLHILRWLSLAAMACLGVYFHDVRGNVSYLFGAAIVAELLPGRWRAFWDTPAMRCIAVCVAVTVGTAAAFMVLGPGMAMGMFAFAGAALLLFAPNWSLLAVRLTQPARVSLGVAVLGVASLAVGLLGHSHGAECYHTIYDFHRDPILRRIHHGQGMILTASNIRLIQLRTQRPVMLEGAAMNQLPYVPESGPSMNHILKRLYGEDLFAPRPEWWEMQRGGLMETTGKKLWESRTEQQWQTLANEFGFTEIVTHDNWKLNLPVVAKSKSMILYRIPGASVETYLRLVGRTPTRLAASSAAESH